MGTILLIATSPLGPVATTAAQDAAAEARAERPQLVARFPEAFAPVVDDPALPRVLLVGDSISIGYTPGVRDRLRGIANIHRIPDNGGPTTRGLAMLDEWLGESHWDVIHFNFGLHDIARVNDGQPRTTPADYAKHLRAIIARLERTGARLVFATTTPVPDATVRPARRNEDAITYNHAAVEVMREKGIPIEDLHAFAQPRLADLQQPANVHFTAEGYDALAAVVAAAIRGRLEP